MDLIINYAQLGQMVAAKDKLITVDTSVYVIHSINEDSGVIILKPLSPPKHKK